MSGTKKESPKTPKSGAPEDRNSGTKTEGRNPDGTFASGNPGKPKGSRHRATQALERLVEGSSEALTQKALDMALAGDMTALRLCLERIAPPRKDAPVSFELPPMDSASEAARAASAIVQAVSNGDITPLEGASVMGLIENYRRVLEVSEIERRICELERAGQ
ncbi:MAG: hypothetical protein HKN27_06990 [Silicimonas sp.]|nr:hypothetical protein [Silicimonas sp.]